MYLTYIFAQIHIVNRGWDLEKLKTITIYMRLIQTESKHTFIHSVGKGQ